nr:uncharacterized protein LOC112032007 [Quercus suber]POF00233.1 hypothetical protein CFP56_37742 [Quercus suber]
MIRISCRQKRHWRDPKRRALIQTLKSAYQSNEKNANKKQIAKGGIVATTSAVAVTETTAGAGEARVVAASSGDSVVDATSVGDSTAGGGGTNSPRVVVPNCGKWWSKQKKKKP